MWLPGGKCATLRTIVWALVLTVTPLHALQAQDWEPPLPMPDEFDWIQLNSGEWLKGEIRVMYQDSLEFESEELNLVSFDLEDIRVIRSAQLINLRVRSGETVIGKLLLDADDVTVIGDEQATFTRADILSITAGVQTERNYWSGDLVINGNYRSGNTEQVDTGVVIRSRRRTVISRVIIDFQSNFTQTNGVQTVDSQSGNMSWDRFRSATVFVRPLFGEYFSDPFQNIRGRYTIGAGIGYQLLDTSRTDWSIFAGPAYQGTKFDEVGAGETDSEQSFAVTSGTAFEIALTRRIDLIADYRFTFTDKEAGGYSHRMSSTIEVELTGSLDFNISGEWNRIQNPKPNADNTLPQQDDFRLSFGVGYEF